MDQERKNQDALFKLIKIFLIQYLSTVHGFKGFQTEAINMMALYILRIIKHLVIPTKRLVSLQGRVMPNCLHLVDTIRTQKEVRLIKLINFLDDQAKYSNENVRISANSLQNLSRQFFDSDDVETINGYSKETTHQSIRTIPYCYTYDYKSNPLHLKSPIDESFKKPADHTFRNDNKKVQKQEKAVEQLTNYSMREMRRSLGILNLKDTQVSEAEKRGEKKIKKSIENQNGDKPKFSMINFI